MFNGTVSKGQRNKNADLLIVMIAANVMIAQSDCSRYRY